MFISIIIYCIYFSCSFNEQNFCLYENSVREIVNENSVDRINLIAEKIDNEFELQSDSTTVFGLSSQGANLVRFYDIDGIHKIEITYYGERGKLTDTYYLYSDCVILQVERETLYGGSIYDDLNDQDEHENELREIENNYYITKKKLIAWFKNGEIVSDHEGRYSEKYDELLSGFLTVKSVIAENFE